VSNDVTIYLFLNLDHYHCVASQSFDSRTIHLKEHTIVFTEGKKKHYQCGICLKVHNLFTFSDFKKLKIFSFFLKGKYRFNSHLNVHLGVHTGGEIAFECKHCGKVYMDNMFSLLHT